MSCQTEVNIDTKCIRCRSPDTKEWRVDHHGLIKFYCNKDWEQWLKDKELLTELRMFGEI